VLSSSEKVFKQEIAWATHLSVPAVLLPTPQIQCFNYGRVLNQSVLNAQYLQFWVRIPLTYRTHSTAGHHQMEMPTTPDTRTSTSVGSIDTKDDSTICTTSPWEAWNHLRSMCEYHPKIQVALELTGDLSSHEELQRWLGEPIKAVILPTDIFLTNRKGFPTLSQMHQRFLLKLFQFQKIQYFFKGKARHCHENSTGHFLPYIQYLHFLYGKRQQMDTKAFFEAPYLDYLQAPLQPLMDNLESQTYETFEQDSCKYQQYELAITKALLKKNISCIEKKTVVMVVGAGRGPLVRCALRAAKNSNRKIKMYAIEKNPNAVIT
jgi:protein arginine N-methyltransferase 5